MGGGVRQYSGCPSHFIGTILTGAYKTSWACWQSQFEALLGGHGLPMYVCIVLYVCMYVFYTQPLADSSA